MRVAVSLNNSEMLRLLYLRDSWALDCGADVPHLFPRPAKVNVPADVRTEVAQSWTVRWDSLKTWAIGLQTSELDHDTGEVQGPMAAPPIWNDTVRGPFFPELAFQLWSVAFEPRNARPLNEIPEFRSQKDVRKAWNRGLRCIIVLPYDRPFTRTTGPGTLEIDLSTYEDLSLFEAAVRTFVNSSP